MNFLLINNYSINPELVSSVQLHENGGLTISVGNDVISVEPGATADRVRADFGLGDPSD